MGEWRLRTFEMEVGSGFLSRGVFNLCMPKLDTVRGVNPH